jgi:fatty-acid desaturase
VTRSPLLALAPLLALFLASYCLRMWGTEAVYHRYFSHRAFQADRFAQVILALIGLQTGQRSAVVGCQASRSPQVRGHAARSALAGIAPD